MVKFMVYKWLEHHDVEGKAVQFLSTGDVHGELKLVCTALPWRPVQTLDGLTT